MRTFSLRLPWWLLLIAFITAGGVVRAETIPAAPPRHFNDFAGVVDRASAAQLDHQLAQFERDTSNQILVVVYPKMQSESSIEDYTVRVAKSWKVGEKGRDNGAVLFVFIQDRAMYIQVGYGLEGAIPDATASRIIRQEITPRFRAGDIAGGLKLGTRALMEAAKGEYKGTGRTVTETHHRPVARQRTFSPFLIFIVVLMLVGSFARRSRRSVIGGRRSWHNNDDDWFGPGRGGGLGGFGGFGGFGGGGSSSGGGGFSGGGGNFGGGGAGGRW